MLRKKGGQEHSSKVRLVIRGGAKCIELEVNWIMMTSKHQFWPQSQHSWHNTDFYGCFKVVIALVPGSLKFTSVPLERLSHCCWQPECESQFRMQDWCFHTFLEE